MRREGGITLLELPILSGLGVIEIVLGISMKFQILLIIKVFSLEAENYLTNELKQIYIYIFYKS